MKESAAKHNMLDTGDTARKDSLCLSLKLRVSNPDSFDKDGEESYSPNSHLQNGLSVGSTISGCDEVAVATPGKEATDLTEPQESISCASDITERSTDAAEAAAGVDMGGAISLPGYEEASFSTAASRYFNASPKQQVTLGRGSFAIVQ